MPAIDSYEMLYVLCAFVFQLVLMVHFSLRKWFFGTAMRFGPIVYALSIPAALVSIQILSAGKPWWMWLGGFMYLLWAIYGYTIEYIYRIQWRNPLKWKYFGPYITLYLTTVMFYWWPLARINKHLWSACAILFVINTALNITSHKPRQVAGI